MRKSNDEPSTPEPVSLYIHCTLFGLSKFKQKAGHVKSLTDWMCKFTKTADSFAQGIREHVNLGPKITEVVKGKLSMGTRILQAGGIQRAFRQSFPLREREKLLKAFQCYLSTTAGPIAGLLFVSNKKIAFISDTSLTIASSNGEAIRVPYKVVIPLRKIMSTNESEHVDRPSQRLMQIVTMDGFEFWFMGFLYFQRCLKYIKSAMAEYHKLSMHSKMVASTENSSHFGELVQEEKSCIKSW